MTPAELVAQIESTGGKLSVMNDGALLCDGANAELLNELQPMKAAVVDFLQERARRPRRYSALFTNEELQAMRDRYESQQREARIREYAAFTANAPDSDVKPARQKGKPA